MTSNGPVDTLHDISATILPAKLLTGAKHTAFSTNHSRSSHAA